MSKLDEIRAAHPELNDIPDLDLADIVHETYFADMPKNDYYREIELDVPGAAQFQPEDYQGVGEASVRAIGRTPENLVNALGTIGKGVPSALLHPIESGKAFVAEGMRGANTLAQNLPNNIVEYLRERSNRKRSELQGKDYGTLTNALREMVGLPTLDTEPEIPEYITGDWASPETKQSLNKAVESYAPEYRRDLAGTELAGTIGRYAPATALSAITGLGPVAGIGAQDIAENRNPIEGALLAKSLKEGGKNIKPIAKGALDITKKLPGGETLSNITGKAIEPIKKLQEAKDLQKSLLEMDKQKNELSKDLGTKKEGTASRVASKIEKESSNIENTAQEIREFAPMEEAASRKQLQNALHEKSRELRLEANENFENVYAEPVGSKTLGTSQLKAPLVKSNIAAGFYNDALRHLIDVANAEGEIPASLAPSSKGAPTIKQAVDFAKLVQKERMRAYNKSRVESIPEADARYLEKIAPKLSELEQDIWAEIEQNTTSNQFSNIRDAFKKWGETVTPFETHKFLEDASSKYGKINSPKAFEALNKLGQDELVKRLVQDPKVNEALAKHDLMGLDVESIDAIKSLLGSDQGRALPQEIKTKLKTQVKQLENLDALDKAGKSIYQSQIRSIINEPKIKNILKQNPGLLEELADIRTTEKALKQLEQRMKDANISQKEINAKIGIISKAASIVGLGYLVKILS